MATVIDSAGDTTPKENTVTGDARDRGSAESETAFWVQRVTLLTYLTAIISGGLLVVGYAAESRWVYAGICVLIAGMSVLSGEVSKVRGLNGVAFAGLAYMAMLLVWRDNSAVLALAATTFALASWDLHAYRQRLTSVESVPAPRAHTIEHLRRLVLALGVGLALGLLGMWVRIDTGVGVVAGLILLAAVGLTGAIRFLTRSSD